jgi:hypothetical protein
MNYLNFFRDFSPLQEMLPSLEFLNGFTNSFSAPISVLPSLPNPGSNPFSQGMSWLPQLTQSTNPVVNELFGRNLFDRRGPGLSMGMGSGFSGSSFSGFPGSSYARNLPPSGGFSGFTGGGPYGAGASPGAYGGMQSAFGGQTQQRPGGLSPGGMQGGQAGAYDFSGMFRGPTLVGQQKWSGGGNSIDVFTRKGEPILAPFDGEIRTLGTQLGPVPGTMIMLTDPRTGFSMRLVHTKPVAQGRVRKGQPIAIVDDPGMDMLRWPGGQYGNAPGGYQHAQVDFAEHPGGFRDGPMGGTMDALRVLTGGGFRPSQMVGRTPGPPEGMGGGMGMGGPFGGMGGGPMGMMGGMGGNPLMSMLGMGGPMGGMGGMSPFGGMGGGMSPFGGMGMGGFPGMGGMGGFPGMGMFSPMMGMFG